MRLSELPEARARYDEALPIYRAIGERVGEANCIKSLGDVHMRLSELPEARARYDEALPIYRAIGERVGEANCIQSLGELSAEDKDFASALQLLEKAAKRYRTLGLPANEAGAVNSIANVYDKQKNYQKAIETYTRALTLFPEQTAYILRNRANQYLKVKDTTNAARDIETAAKIQPQHPYLSLRRGELASLLGNYDEAISQFHFTLELYPRMNGAYFGIGLAHLRAGKAAESIVAYQQGLALTNARSELDDTIEELEKLYAEQPELKGIVETLNLVKNWKRG